MVLAFIYKRRVHVWVQIFFLIPFVYTLAIIVNSDLLFFLMQRAEYTSNQKNEMLKITSFLNFFFCSCFILDPLIVLLVCNFWLI